MTHTTPMELETDCKRHWGVIERRQKNIFDRGIPPLLDFWDFQSASDDMKAFVAYKLIFECTPRVGAYWDNGDMQGFIHKFAHDIEWSRGNFDDRRTKALRSALLLIAHHSWSPPRPSQDIDIILSGGAAPASAYLLAMIEFLFRTRSRYLNEEGKLIRIIPKQLQIKVKLKKNKTGYRVNQIQKAFHLFVYRNTEEPALMFRDLQRRIKIDERLNLIRHPTMHGSNADPACEAPFYSLVLALFYYTERAS